MDARLLITNPQAKVFRMKSPVSNDTVVSPVVVRVVVLDRLQQCESVAMFCANVGLFVLMY